MGALNLRRDPEEWIPKVDGSMDVAINMVGMDWYELSHKALNKEVKHVVVGTQCL